MKIFIKFFFSIVNAIYFYEAHLVKSYLEIFKYKESYKTQLYMDIKMVT